MSRFCDETKIVHVGERCLREVRGDEAHQWRESALRERCREHGIKTMRCDNNKVDAAVTKRGFRVSMGLKRRRCCRLETSQTCRR